MTVQEIRGHIENIIDETRHQTLKELNAIKHIGINSDKNMVVLIIQIGMLGTDAEVSLRRKLAKIIKIDLGFTGIKIQLEEVRTINNIASRNTKFIIVASAKGGVGKSTVACNLAYQLSLLNKNVGIIDADIYNSTVPSLLNVDTISPEVNSKGRIIPFKFNNIEFISIAFFNNKYDPVLWKSSVLTTMLNNFFFQVEWSKNLDYIIIDTPCGTGDVIIELNKLVPQAEVLLVTTKDQLSVLSTIKTGFAFKQMKHNIIGIVENMNNIFPNNNKENISEVLETEILASFDFEIPLLTLGLFSENQNNAKISADLATLITIR